MGVREGRFMGLKVFSRNVQRGTASQTSFVRLWHPRYLHCRTLDFACALTMRTKLRKFDVRPLAGP